MSQLQNNTVHPAEPQNKADVPSQDPKNQADVPSKEYQNGPQTSEDQNGQQTSTLAAERQSKIPTCYNCGHKGHKVPDCPVPRASGRRLPFDPRRTVKKASRHVTVVKFTGGSHTHHTHYH